MADTLCICSFGGIDYCTNIICGPSPLYHDDESVIVSLQKLAEVLGLLNSITKISLRLDLFLPELEVFDAVILEEWNIC